MYPSQKPQKKSRARWLSALLCLALSFCVLFSAAAPAQAAVTQEQINSLKGQQEKLASQKSDLQNKLSGIQTEKANALDKKAALEEQVEVIRQQLQVAANLIASYDQQIEEKGVELEAARAEEARYYDLFCQRVRGMEKGGNVSYWAVLFQAQDFADLLDRMSIVNEVMRYDNDVMDALAAARERVNAAKLALEDARAEQQNVQAQLSSYKSDLEGQQRTLDSLIAQIQSQESAYEEQIHVAEAQQEDLSGDIAAAERQYAAQLAAARRAAEEAARRAQNNQGSSSGGGSSTHIGGSTTASTVGRGGYVWPLPGYTRVNSRFGYRICPFHGRESHTGIDVPAPGGTPIVAAKDGTVVLSRYGGSYGNYIVIAHTDGSKTLYAHMSARVAQAGNTVGQGATIGYVGTTGSSTGNHLHFEVWAGSSSSSRVDPLSYF